MKIAVKTKDDYLYQKIFLILSKTDEVFRYTSKKTAYDLLLSDEISDAAQGTVTMSRNEKCDLAVPFNEAELKDAVLGNKQDKPFITLGEKCVFHRGRKIALTELEFSLFSVLYKARGQFVPRNIIHSKVFGEEHTDGAINVYVHYLRDKLESEDEKVIISSRKQGYKISERYF